MFQVSFSLDVMLTWFVACQVGTAHIYIYTYIYYCHAKHKAVLGVRLSSEVVFVSPEYYLK